ncbi:MAG TPA: hypothetical protein PJ998_06645 [Terrimesophilobacter sp.]|nr:hypothetical protein [Terrimesophilobacter sp.]
MKIVATPSAQQVAFNRRQGFALRVSRELGERGIPDDTYAVQPARRETVQRFFSTIEREIPEIRASVDGWIVLSEAREYIRWDEIRSMGASNSRALDVAVWLRRDGKLHLAELRQETTSGSGIRGVSYSHPVVVSETDLTLDEAPGFDRPSTWHTKRHKANGLQWQEEIRSYDWRHPGKKPCFRVSFVTRTPPESPHGALSLVTRAMSRFRGIADFAGSQALSLDWQAA